jgi:arsenate reductase
MSQDDMAEWLGSDGMLVKRPLLVGPSFVLNGFNKEEWERHLL